jgi:5'(3')-deoxyribonucleotidase
LKQCRACARELEPLEACGCLDRRAANDNVAQSTAPTIYFDMDGVLANFDKGAEEAIGTNNIYKFEFVYGQDAFWAALNSRHDFFRNLEMMPGARRMLSAVPRDRVKVLTALPKSDRADSVRRQKQEWAQTHLHYSIPVITCLTHEKPDYCKPGDVLIDDRAVNKAKWEAKGGRFIVHTDVENTLAQLKSMGLTK